MRKEENIKTHETAFVTSAFRAFDENFNDQSHLIETYKNLIEKFPKTFFDQGTILGEEDTFWHL